MALTYPEARAALAAAGQEHLLQFWPRLNAEQQRALLSQIAELKLDQLAQLRALLPHAHPAAGARGGAGAGPGAIEPAEPVALAPPERAAARSAGEAALRTGRVGVLLVAGGQGTRLGFDGPKGTFALGPVSGASLFEIHARKIAALRRRYRAAVPLYIMTSRGNDVETQQFFAVHDYFGLAPRSGSAGHAEPDVHFFIQGTLPALWPDGRIVLEAPDRLATAPDGHGGVLAALKRNSLLDQMARRGVTTLFYFQVDNPLAAIADPVFIGLHLSRRAQMSLKVCAKRDPEEGLGVVVLRNGRLAVVEYTELTPEQKHARQADGTIHFKYGSVAIHTFDLEFLRREADADLPLHRAHKKVPFCDDNGVTLKPDHANAYKFEKFIFDALPDAERAVALEFAREDEFAPVKNATGHDSPHTARSAMMAIYARWLEECGHPAPRGPDGELARNIEIDPCFAADADELRSRLPREWAWGAGDVWLK